VMRTPMFVMRRCETQPNVRLCGKPPLDAADLP
jgi:hypothetical protein